MITLKHIWEVAEMNSVFRSYIGMGYYNTVTPSVILRNIFENPGWYTQYTPYQAEIAQGRLEGLLNFQTLISDLTALPVANASLLDEATAAGEAMIMLYHSLAGDLMRNRFCILNSVFPQTKDVLVNRAAPLGIDLVEGKDFLKDEKLFGVLIQYPDGNGAAEDWREIITNVMPVM
jgi:glycine dehydrogenase